MESLMENPAVGPSSVTEVEFVARETSHPFVQASVVEDCVVELAEMLPRSDCRYSEFFTVDGATPSAVRDAIPNRSSIDVTVLRETDSGGLVEFVVSDRCPAVRLAKLGAYPRVVRGVDGRGRVAAEIPPERDDHAVVEPFLRDNPSFGLKRKRDKEAISPRFTSESFQRIVAERLTERQREVMQTAYQAGYYDWPRQCAGTDVAESLDITSATFSQHIHAAERKVLAVLFDEES